MKRYWVSSKKMTFEVTVSLDGIIVDAAPIARKFIGQRFINLRRWMAKQGGLEVVEQKEQQ